MNLDTLVKLSQIATPFVLLGLGFLVSKSVNKYIHNHKVTTEFNTRWSDEFITKCRVYSDKVSDVTLMLHEFFTKSQDGNDFDKKAFEKQFAVQVNDISRSYYKLEIHSSIVDNSNDVLKVAADLFEITKNNLKIANTGGGINFNEVKDLQKKLYSHLKKLEKSILEL